ncbi:Tyrosine recombinase XerD [compost metagenome]
MYVRGWRAFFNWMHSEGYITEDVGGEIKLIKAEKRVIQTFTKEQLKRLLDTPNRAEFTGYRNYLAMLLLLDTMCRVSELVTIELPNINWKDRTIKILGKGKKERLIPFQATAERHLQEYIKIRGHLDHDYLFVNIDNGPLSKRTLQQEITKIGAEAGIKGVRVSPHTFRHTGARMYIMAQGDIFSLQKILGHSSLDIVRNYVNLWGTDVAAQHARYSPLEQL